MTVATSTNKTTPALTNGAATVFPFTFPVQEASDIQVYLATLATGQETLLTSPTNYSISMLGDPAGSNGGSVTTVTAYPAGYSLTIVRVVPITQEVDLSNEGGWFPEVHEAALDRLTMQLQQVNEKADRAVRVPITTSGVNAAIPAPRAGSVIGSTDGERFENLELVVAGQAIAGNWTVDRFMARAVPGPGVFVPGSTYTLVLSREPASAQSLLVTFDGVVQHCQTFSMASDGMAFVVLTFDAPIPVGVDAVEVRIPTTLAVGQPSDGSVGPTQLASFAVTPGKIAAGAVTTDKIARLPFWASILNSTELAITAAGAATAGRMHVVSGTSADYTITLPVAPAAGTVVGLRVMDYAAANKLYTLDAGGTVKIAGRTRYLVLLHTNVVLLRFDGTDWQPLVLSLDSPWVTLGAVTITASVNPTKGTTTTDTIRWRRSGNDCIAHMAYRQSGAGSSGTGDYVFSLPFSADTAKIPILDTSYGNSDVGSASASVGANTGGGAAMINSSTTVTLLVGFSTGSGVAGSTLYGLVSSGVNFSYHVNYPVVNW